MHSSHSARFIQVSIHPLQLLTSRPLQRLAALAPDPSPVVVHGALFGGLPNPALPSPLRLRDVGPHAGFTQLTDDLATVIALIRDYFHWPLRRHRFLRACFIDRLGYDLNVLGGLFQRGI